MSQFVLFRWNLIVRVSTFMDTYIQKSINWYLISRFPKDVLWPDIKSIFDDKSSSGYIDNWKRKNKWVDIKDCDTVVSVGYNARLLKHTAWQVV